MFDIQIISRYVACGKARSVQVRSSRIERVRERRRSYGKEKLIIIIIIIIIIITRLPTLPTLCLPFVVSRCC
jgi:hypothetical protein